MKPTSIPEHNRTAEIQNQIREEATKPIGAIEVIVYPLIITLKVIRDWWGMYD